MNFAFTDEQAMIAQTARAFFAEHATSARTRTAMASADGIDAELWNAFVELGLVGIAIPAAFGGSDLGAVELAILCEAAGAHVAALPMIATLGLAAPALIAGGSEDQKAEWLPKLVSGTIATFGDGPLVAHGAAAELLLLADGSRVALVARGAATLDTPNTMDQTRPLARVTAWASTEHLAEGAVALAAARSVGAVAVAADALGGAQACLDRTVAFTTERVQFGRPIGGFQAIKHRLADVMVMIEQARSAVYWAACAVDECSADRDIAVHSAKAAACDAYTQAAAAMVQLHGGIGFTWEHDAHLFFKRARANATLLGTPDWHRERVAQLIGLDAAAWKLGFAPEEEAFRAEAAAWLAAELNGSFADVRGLTNLIAAPERRREWEKRLGEAGWSCIGWPAAFGGRDATLAQQVLFAEEYARAGGPPRLGHIGVELIGPTILALGTEAQKARFLPAIAAGDAIWCQGYSEPSAGSDLANVRTRARREGDDWVIDGHKIWTSLAQFADWVFLIVRTEDGSRGAKGLSFLLAPMDQPGIEIAPIEQMTGDAEFNELFLSGARASAGNMIGAPGEGWSVSNALLGFERGISTLGQQMGFRNELDEVVAAAKANGAAREPLIRQRIAQAEIGLRLMRYGALRMLSGEAGPAALTYKIQWASWRQALGELAIDVLGQTGEIADSPLATLYLYSRADTIYGGTNEIQRNLIAERGLGLPREPRGDRQG